MEPNFAWLGCNCRFGNAYEFRAHISATMIDIAAGRLVLNRIAQE